MVRDRVGRSFVRCKYHDMASNFEATKKLINQPEDCVDDHLKGFVAAHPTLVLLKGCRIALRDDIEEFKRSSKVAIVSGGGSGHEPAFAGYVGRGGLSAAVAGSVFASPPPSQVLAAISAVRNPCGVLVIVFNYTGDRLNFGIAVERARGLAPEIPIQLWYNADDCALTSADRSAGRRGVAGGILIIKIAGALAEEGKSLDRIVSVLQFVSKNMGTIGLSLGSCSLPGSGPIFKLEVNQMELGLGLHGEPGVSRIGLLSARDSVNKMLSHMTNKDSATHLEINNGEQIAVLINNLGGTTQLEMNIICSEVINWLDTRGVIIKRFYCNSFITSLEMHGVSVTVLKTNEEILNYLDAPTNCPSWQPAHRPQAFEKYQIKQPLHLDNQLQHATAEEIGPEMTLDDTKRFISCLRSVCDVLITSESYLNSLDKACGDGDCGSTMRRAADAVKLVLDQGNLNSRRPATLLREISVVVEGSSGGTSGAIYSLFLSAAAAAFQESTDCKAWVDAFIAGYCAVVRYGGAVPGDRTLVDPLSAVTDLLEKHPVTCIASELFRKAAEVAQESAQATKAMSARSGRASYVNKDNLTEPDPGAIAAALWIKAACDAFTD